MYCARWPKLSNPSAQILILTGSGKAFCSGMDLDNLRSITGRSAEENRADSATMARLFRTLIRISPGHDCRGQWAGDRRRLRPGHAM